MSDNQRPDPLDDFNRRLYKAREVSNQRVGIADEPEERAARRLAFKLAGRAGVEIVAGFGFGAAVGWLLDKWLGTWPWLLILFILLGTAAGMMNTLRVVWKPISGQELPVWARGGGLSKLGNPDSTKTTKEANGRHKDDRR